MELTFTNDGSSVDCLDAIMNSYPGRNCGSIMADPHSVSVMISLLLHRKIVVTEHTYCYDSDISDDSEMMAIYAELARETRWRQFEHTEIERIRINALRQMRQDGVPFYDGDFICYQEGRTCVHCGNLHLHDLLTYLAAHEQAEQFCMFTYPYCSEDHTAKYYRFHLTGDAIAGAKIYCESIWDKMRRASEVQGIIPVISDLEDGEPPR